MALKPWFCFSFLPNLKVFLQFPTKSEVSGQLGWSYKGLELVCWQLEPELACWQLELAAGAGSWSWSWSWRAGSWQLEPELQLACCQLELAC